MKEAHDESNKNKSSLGKTEEDISDATKSKSKERTDKPKDLGLEAQSKMVAGEAPSTGADPVNKLFRLDEVRKGLENLGRLRNDLINGLVKRQLADELASNISLDLSKKYMQGKRLAEQLEKEGKPSKPLSRDEAGSLAVYRKIKDELPAKFPFYDTAVLKKDLELGIAKNLIKPKASKAEEKAAITLHRNALSVDDNTKGSGEAKLKSDSRLVSKAESKPALKPDLKPDLKSDSKHASRPEAKPDLKIDTKTEFKANSNSRYRSEPESKPVEKNNSQPQTQVDNQAKVQIQPKLETTIRKSDNSPGYCQGEIAAPCDPSDAPKGKVQKIDLKSQQNFIAERAEEPSKPGHLLKEAAEKLQADTNISRESRNSLESRTQNTDQDRVKDSEKNKDKDQVHIEHKSLESGNPAIQEESRAKHPLLQRQDSTAAGKRSESNKVTGLSEEERILFVGIDFLLHKIARSSLTSLVFHRSSEIALARISEVLTSSVFSDILQKKPLAITNAPDRSVKTLIFLPTRLPQVEPAGTKNRDRLLSLPFSKQWQHERELTGSTTYRASTKLNTLPDRVLHLESTKIDSRFEGARPEIDVKGAMKNSVINPLVNPGVNAAVKSEVNLEASSELPPDSDGAAVYAGQQTNRPEEEKPSPSGLPLPPTDGGDELYAPGGEMVFAAIIALAAVARTRQDNLASFGEERSIGGQVLQRPKILIAKDDTFDSIADRLFHDRSLAHLIADLNLKVCDEFILSGNRIIRLKVRQEIQLPVYTDIVSFKKERANAALYSAPLVTIVEDTEISKEALRQAFSPFVKGHLV
ncbi:MAG: hypothetical protein K2Y32_18920 [Candidatus Obscuribacterales bacterium]|nr:hypothetical protein [Candidatus Obscuribacterales bacterium]